MTDSIWLRTLSAERRAALERSDEPPFTVDILIVGGGLVGLAAAYYLSKAQVGSIAVIDRDAVAAQASSANAGGLWFAHESSREGVFSDLARLSDRLYLELGEELDFEMRRDGILDLVWNEEEFAEAAARGEALREAGFEAEMVEPAQLRSLEPGLSELPAGALLTPNDGQLHPLELAAAYAERLRERGVKLSNGVEALSLGSTVETTRGPISAGLVIVAAGAWTPLLTQTIGWRPPIKPIRGGMLALPPQSPGTVPHTVMAKDFYYWQIGAGPVAGGGSHEDVGFEPGVDDATLGAIRAELASLLPGLADQPTQCHWSGFRPFCEDGYPIVGAVPGVERLYASAGHFRKGVMLSPASGKALADLILHGDAEIDIGALSPARFAPSPV